MFINPRSSWQARPPKKTNRLPNTDNGWVFHWNGPAVTADTTDYLAGTQRYHMHTKGWHDIAYHFAVDNYGDVYELRGWDVQGGATSGYAPDGQAWNKSSHALLFCIGVGQIASPKALEAAEKLVQMRPGRVTAHRDASAGTMCPGDQLARFSQEIHSTKVTPTMDPNTTVTRAYIDYLGRKPDQAGLDYWVGQIDSGARTPAQVDRAILAIALTEARHQTLTFGGGAVIDEIVRRLQGS